MKLRTNEVHLFGIDVISHASSRSSHFADWFSFRFDSHTNTSFRSWTLNFQQQQRKLMVKFYNGKIMRIFIKKLLAPHHYWRRVFLLSVSIVLLGLFISISKSHHETIHRLRNVEYLHGLLVKEISGSPDFKRASQLVFDMMMLRSKDRQQFRARLSTLNTIHTLATELQQIKEQHSNRNRERTDYALSTAGATILSTGRTRVILTPLPQWMSVLGFSGISKLFVNGAHRVIQPSNEPGECFAFSGHGEIIIKLIKPIFIDAITVEHIPPNISPDGHILSAPNLFSVYGMETANEPNNPYHLGTFKYDIESKQSRQEFRVANIINKSFSFVKFEFAPNPSPLNYTCIYRIRVHGSLPTEPNWARANGHGRISFVCIVRAHECVPSFYYM